MTSSLRAPRVSIAATIALVLALVLAAVASPAIGRTPSPSPSGAASPSPAAGLSIELLNPSTAYDPAPKISDRFDGTDTAYSIVARTTGSPDPVIVEAEFRPERPDGTYDNPRTIGQLERVGDESDVWELDWDVPASVDDGLALFAVRAYVETADGFVEAGSDEVVVEISHGDPSPSPIGAYETVDLRWPEQDGALGWYRPRVGAYRVVISGTTSPGATFVQLLVSTSPAGEPLTFTPCGTAPTTGPGTQPFRSFAGRCTLSAVTFPSQVRAVAAIAEFRHEATGLRFPNAADARVVHPYVLSPEDMSVRFSPAIKRAPAPATVCQTLAAIVTDEHGQLVLGANLDVHVTGPTDQVTVLELGLKAPEGHHTETTPVCPGAPPVPGDPNVQGDHNIPAALDPKHKETTNGSGLDYQAQLPGQSTFKIASAAAGFTDVVVWVDDEEIRRETDQRPPDNDVLDAGEPAGHARIQWLGAPVTLSLDPVGGTAPAGTCFPYTVKARSGVSPVPGINVDLHATGPVDELDFCDPAGALPRRAPSAGTGAAAHEAEETSESHHFSSSAPDTQHTEGETDAAGNFVVGLTSPDAGDSTVTAWVDGETGSDDDVQGGTEAAASGTISWATSAAEAELGFVNPSPYGSATSGAGNGTQLPDRGGSTDVLVRVDMAGRVPGVEILLSTDARKSYSLLGEATRVGSTDLYELEWPIDLPDGNYGLRARILGTAIVEDVDVKVGAGDLLPMTPAPSYETLRLDKPRIAAGIPFARRSTVVSGRASAGAEGVDVFYTKVPAKDTPRQADWIFCGYAGLDGMGTTTQEFSTLCTLSPADQASQVTGIAAITFDCTAPGCDANPTPATPDPSVAGVREQGQKETGQALRVFGYEAHPLLSVEPPETEAVTGDCRRFHVVLRDQTGLPMGDENVDLHLSAPADAHFCRPSDATPSLRAPDAGGHTASAGDPGTGLEARHEQPSLVQHAEGETLPDGTLVFGLTAASAGDTQITAWVDRADDDLQDADEIADTSLLHWVAPGGCSLVGSAGPDVLVGTTGKDVFCGLEGDDVLRGRGGDDTFFGGPGHDRIYGGAGHDSLKGARGRDLLDGGRGRDTCRGGPGRDRIQRCAPRSTASARRSGV